MSTRQRLHHISFPLILIAVILVALPAQGGGDDDEGAPAPLAAQRTEDCAVSLARAVQDRYRSAHSLSARFEQRSEVVAIGTQRRRRPVEVSTGEVFLEKPSKMRWIYVQPEPNWVISDGEVLWMYDPKAGEAQRMPLGGGLTSMAGVQFLLGEGDILGDFRAGAERCDAADGLAELELTPRAAKSYEKLGLRVEVTSGQIRETAVYDLFGNVTRITLLDTQMNETLDAKLFQFDPPPETRVIELAPPARNR